MRHISVLALFAVTIVLLSGCIEQRCVTGSGNVISEDRAVDRFTSVNLRVPGDLYLTQGSYQPLKIEAEDNILQLLDTNVANDELIVDIDGCIIPSKPIKIFVFMEDIKSLEVSGSGKIISENVIDADAIDAKISGSGGMDLLVECEDLRTAVAGSGNLKLSGVAASHKAVVDGSGKVESYGLSTDISQITISGSGSGEVSVLEELDVKISGSGNVRYKGDPEKIRSDIFGSGRLWKVD
jgi:hypothetical protein